MYFEHSMSAIEQRFCLEFFGSASIQERPHVDRSKRPTVLFVAQWRLFQKRRSALIAMLRIHRYVCLNKHARHSVKTPDCAVCAICLAFKKCFKVSIKCLLNCF